MNSIFISQKKNSSLMLVALLFILAGCGDDPEKSDAVEGSTNLPNSTTATVTENTGEQSLNAKKRSKFLREYYASLEKVEPAKYIELSGKWTGLLPCKSETLPIELDIDKTTPTEFTGEITIGTTVGENKPISPFREHFQNSPTVLSYSPATSHFLLRANSGNKTTRGTALSGFGLMDPAHKNRILLQVHRVCDHAVLVRKEEYKTMQQLLETMAVIREDKRAVTQADCPNDYLEWVKLARTTDKAKKDQPDLTKLLAKDPFERAFGNEYLNMPAENLLKASALISGSCRLEGDKKYRHVHYSLGGMLRDHRFYRSAILERYRAPVLQSWAAWIDGELNRGAPINRQELEALEQLPKSLGMARDERFANLSRRTYKLKRLSDGTRSGAIYAERIESDKDDFMRLYLTQLEVRTRPLPARQAVAMGFDYYLQDAAEAYSESVNNPESAQFIATWVAQFGLENTCPAKSKDVCEEVVEIFNDRLEDILPDFIDTEEDAFEALEDAERNLQTLAALVNYEHDLDARFGLLLDHEEFEDFNEDRSDYRRKLQRRLDDELEETISSATMSTQVTAFEQSYFRAGDLEKKSMRDVFAQMNKVLGQSAPFSRVHGASYFNAIYNQDKQALKRMDEIYMSGMKPVFNLAMGALKAIAPTMSKITGDPGFQLDATNAGLGQLSATGMVLGTYLMNYQDLYKSCLSRQARTIVVRRNYEQSKRDGFGVKIGPVQRWARDSEYRINPEFEEHFNDLFRTAISAGDTGFLDLMLNNGKITRLRNGVGALMKKHECDSPEIKQFEASLRELNPVG